MPDIVLQRRLQGRILDIGGGGEGVIGRLYQSQVTAIDRCPQELEEAPEGFEKLLMEAERLAFPEASFDHVTFFYSLMYMDAQARKAAIKEAARVLRQGGGLHIWDSVIERGGSGCLVELDIHLPAESIHTGYGLLGETDAQDDEGLIALCKACGLKNVQHTLKDGQFHLSFKK